MSKLPDDPLPDSDELEISIEQNSSIDRSDLTISQFLKKQGLKAGVELDDSESSAADSLKDRQGRKYDLGEIIAQGGNGAVLDAKDHCIRRHVAMKVMRETQQSASGVIRFIEEAQVTGELEHPSIVPVHELGVDASGSVFYTMKYVKGRNLSDVLKDIRAGDAATIRDFPLVRLLGIFLKVCDAMAFAHSKGVIHRDLKPGNIMLGDYGEVLVVDWGLAKVLGRDGPDLPEEIEASEGWAVESDRAGDFGDGFQTMVGDVMGTPSYMPPEQAEGQLDQIGVQSDIYSLGAVLYHILTLRPPVSGEDKRTVLAKVSAGEITHPSHYSGKTKALAREEIIELKHCHDRKVPESLAAVAMKSLSKKPSDRYESVLRLQEEVQAYLEGFATLAEHASLVRQCILLFNRNKKEATILTAAAILLVGLTVGFIHQVNQKKQEAEQAAAMAEAARVEAEQARTVAETARREADDARGEAEAASILAEERAESIFQNLYYSEMRLAGRAMQDPGGAELISQLLNKWTPGVAGRDMRGWEWYFLKNQTGGFELELQSGSAVIDLAWSPDGTRLATVERAETLKVWDARDGIVLINKHSPDELFKITVAWSPDGSRLLLGHTQNKKSSIFNLETETVDLELKTMTQRTSWSPSGTRMVTTRKSVVQMWDMPSGEYIRTLRAEGYEIRTVIWSADEKRCFGMSDKAVYEWDADTGALLRSFTLGTARLLKLDCSSDDRLVVAASEDGKLWFLNLETGDIRSMVQAHDHLITALEFSPDDRLLMTASHDRSLKLWDVSTGGLLHTVRAHEAYIYSAAWSPDGQTVASAALDGTIRLWSVRQLLRTRFMPGHGKKCQYACWSPDGKRIAFIEDNKTVVVMDVAAGRLIKELELTTPTTAYGLAWSPNGLMLAGLCKYKGLYLWDAKTYESIPVQDGMYSTQGRSLRWNPDGRRLAICFKMGKEKVRIFDTLSWRITPGFSARNFELMEWSPDGKYVLSNRNSSQPLKLWEAVTGKLLRYSDYFPGRPAAAVWSPDSSRFAVVYGADILIMDPQTMKLVKRIEGNMQDIQSIDWSPDGSRLLTTGRGSETKIWDPETGQECLGIDTGHISINDAAWSPDGRSIVEAGYGGIRIWSAEKP